LSGRYATAAVVATVLATALATPAVAAPLAVPAAPGVRVQPYAIYGAARNDTVLAIAPATFAIPITIPPGARLIAAAAVPDHVWVADVSDTAQPVRFRVVLESGGTTSTLYERTIDIAHRKSDRRWFDFGRDLTPWAGRQGTLRFETTLADASSPPGTVALWGVPDVATCDGSGPSLVLVVLDALRADHLSAMGYARPTSPYLDAFAATAARFTAAFSAAPQTIPSVPQILTGSIFYRQRETPGIGFLGAGRFGTSRAVVNNPWVSIWLSTERPTFDTVVSGDALDARAITSEALRWLTVAGGCRTALYLHYLDTHTPYQPPRRYARKFIDAKAKTTVGLTFDDVTGAWQDKYGDVDRQRIIDLYDGAIAWTDRQLGRLFRGLARRRLLDRTMLVVTADHGEELWDHRKFFHGQSLYDELLHVPLIVHAPGARPARPVTALASSVDLIPTIAEVAHLAPIAGDGTSLASLLRAAEGGAAPSAAPAGAGRMIFATVSHPEPRTPPRHGVRTDTRKLVRNVEDGSVELYDLIADPHELRNLGLAGPGGRELLAVLDTFRLRIADVGDHLRLQSQSAEPVRYIVTLTTDPPAPIVDPDRLTLERGDMMNFGPLAASLTVSGTLAPGEDDHVRMDVVGSTGKLKVRIVLEGAPAPAGILRLGASSRPAGDATIDLADPAWLGAPATPPSPAPGAPPVTVSLWRVARGTSASAPAIDAATRERLRQLGYAE
jgi:hypothetical protein